MLFVTDKSTVVRLNKRTRSLPQMVAALNTAAIPPVFIFNVGPRDFQVSTPRGLLHIPACPEGKPYSEPLAIDGLVLSEYDLGDSGGAMGTTADPGLDSASAAGEKLYGVADDIIGKHSTAAALGLMTTNLEWFGVFSTANNPPTKEELDAARGKLRQMMELIYEDGANKVRQNDPGHLDPNLRMKERELYNDAAKFLGRQLLWGTEDHSLARCPECKEPIIAEANFCKHCQQAIDPASVAARARKRAKANEEPA